MAAPAAHAASTGKGSVFVDPSTVSTTTGAAFTVQITARASVPISGAGESLTFDRTRLQVTAIAQAGPWIADGAVFIGYPSASGMSAAIAKFNAAGSVSGIAAVFLDGSGSEPANTDVPIVSVTFQTIACGSSALGVIAAGNGAGLIDGTPLQGVYGYPVAITTAGATVQNPCSSPSPTSTPTPTATPNPSASASPPPSGSPRVADGTTTVTGTLAAGRLGISAPATASIPLEFGVKNLAEFVVQIDTNRPWALSVRDANTGPGHGHMLSSGGALTESMAVASTKLIDLETGGQIAMGTEPRKGGQAEVTVWLEQEVVDADVAGAYQISLIFEATSSF